MGSGKSIASEDRYLRLTRQMTLPTSSATSRAPCCRSQRRPAGPSPSRSGLTNPARTSLGRRSACPLAREPKITLYPCARCVPRAVLAYEGNRWHRRAPSDAPLGECQPQRSGVRAKSVVGFYRFRHEIRARRLDARIDVLTEVAVGPAIEGAVPDGGHVVGNEIVAEFVSSLTATQSSRFPGSRTGRWDCAGPKRRPGWRRLALSTSRRPRDTFPQPCRFPRHCCWKADGDIELSSIRARDHVFRPMMIEISRRQVDDLFRRAQASLTAGIGNATSASVLATYEPALGSVMPKGAIEAFREGSAKVGDAVAVGIGRSVNPVGAWRCGTRSFHRQLHECLFEAEAFVVLGRRIVSATARRRSAVHAASAGDRGPQRRRSPSALLRCRRGAFLPAFWRRRC